MKIKVITIFTFIIVLGVVGSLIFKFGINKPVQQTEAAISRQGLTLDLNFGNNNAASAPTVYDSSGFNRHATSTAGTTSPTCGGNFCNFDGGDYMTANATNVFNSLNTTVAIKFTPDFAANDGATHFLFDTTVSRYLINKNSSNVIDIYLGGTSIVNIALATFQPYWKVGKENIIIVSGTSGNNNVWLNGNKILNAGATAWTFGNAVFGYFGSVQNGTSSFFDGRMHYFKVWNRLLTDAEVGALSADRETFANSAPIVASSTPDRRLVGHWTMDANDISGTTVYDKSGQNYTGTMTNGTLTSGSGKIKQALTGASTAYINVPGLSWTPTTFSVSYWMYQTSFLTSASTNSVAATNGWNAFRCGSFSTAGLFYCGTDVATRFGVAGAAELGKWQHFVYAYNGTQGSLYKNGIKIAGPTNQTAPTAWGGFTVGQAGENILGKFDDVRVYNYALSATEVANLYSSAKTAYTASAPLIGLVGHWTMDSNDMSATGATIYDRSGKGNHGTVTGTTTSTGRIGQARSFNGTSDYVNLFLNNSATTTISPTQAVTLSAWIKTTQTGNYNIIGNTFGTMATGFYLINVSSAMRFGINDYPSHLASGANTSFFTDNKWHHFVGTYDKSVVRTYVDGRAGGTSGAYTADIVYKADNAFTMGYIAGLGFFNGSIDDVRVYNRALTATEISNLYQSSARNYVQ